jgi:uncharacterized repeat protein (TIGR01451 family)
MLTLRHGYPDYKFLCCLNMRIRVFEFMGCPVMEEKSMRVQTGTTQRAGLATVLALALSAATVAAAAGPDVQVRMQGNQQIHSKDGTSWANFKDGSAVAPGERILYNVELLNRGDKEARNASAFGPIPAGTAFVPETATTAPNLKLEYSIDGGKTFSAKPVITRTAKDGRPETVSAPPEQYTTIRWSMTEPLAPGARVQLSYQVQVR